MVKYLKYAERRYASMKNQEPERDETVLNNDIQADEKAFAEANNFNEAEISAVGTSPLGDADESNDEAEASVSADALGETEDNESAAEPAIEIGGAAEAIGAPAVGESDEQLSIGDTAEASDDDEAGEREYSALGADELGDIFVPEVIELSDGEPVGDESEQTDTTKKAFKADGIFEFVEMLVFTFAAVLLVLSFVFRHSVVDGGSMKNTLHHGEHLIISDLFYEPERFDIIVFEDRSTGFDEPMIKRVIALGGETVEINTLGEVRVNGELLEESYTYVGNPMYAYRTMTYVVPEGQVFVMGDHRDDSYDSRFYGAIDEDTILGKVVLRFAPFDKFGKVK